MDTKTQTPILLLQSDIWTLIAPLIDYEDISRLLLTGAPALTLTIGHGVHSLSGPTNVSAVDLDALLHTCRLLPQLKELIIKPARSEICLMKPRKPINFPPTLTSLNASFLHALAFFTNALKIHMLLPGLRTLHLSGHYSWQPRLSSLKLPTNLESLSIYRSQFKLSTGDIAKLPRSLTHIELTLDKLYPTTRYEWPPHLTSVHLIMHKSPPFLEQLPRTVHILTLEASDILKSSYEAANTANPFFFPWRAFFPFLHHITLHAPVPHTGEHLATALVSVPPDEASQIAKFLTDPSWNIPGLEFDPERTYPLFEFIEHQNSDTDSDAYRPLAPYLKKADMKLHYPILKNPKNFALFPSATQLHCKQPLEGNVWRSTSLRSIQASSIDFSLLEHLPNLTYLKLLGAPSDQNTSIESVKWPSKLEHLRCCHAFTPSAIASLPASLTSLELQDISVPTWTAIATTMASLRELGLTFHSPDLWTPSEPLTPFQSVRLATFRLEFHFDESGPVLHTFFGPTASSPLPPSVTALHISSNRKPVSLAICPYLPRQLQRLNIPCATFAEDSSYCPPSGISPEKLLKSMPPGLTSIAMGSSSNAVCASSVALRALPRSLTSLIISGLFQNDDSEQQIVKMLPPRLVACLLINSSIPDIYQEVRRPYLYRGESSLK